jgi:hypothetical protein
MKLGLPVYVKYPALVLLAWGTSNLMVLAYKKIGSRVSKPKGAVVH